MNQSTSQVSLDSHTPPVDGTSFVEWMQGHARKHGFELDAAQHAALAYFHPLFDGLLRLDRPWIRRLLMQPQAKGIYLWGGVGRGKTFLMDSFFACVPLARKRRVHFHRFMQDIHQRLAGRQGEADPMPRIARELSKQSVLLCLDEFHVTDIGDAMLIRRLLEGLFASGTVLVTTSNLPPDELYRYGLQRGQFLPAIALIRSHLDIVHMDGGADYRLRAYENAGVYHIGNSDQPLQSAFMTIARHHSDGTTALDIAGRMIKVRQHGAGIVWFDFNDLCGAPRGKPDYIEIAQHYHTVIISGIPQFTAAVSDQRQRFIWLVDEFYDRRVKLIASAATTPEALDSGNEEFVRTASRLAEMQTSFYLGLPHLP